MVAPSCSNAKPLLFSPSRFQWREKKFRLPPLSHSTTAIAYSDRLTEDTNPSAIDPVAALVSLRRLPEAFAAFSLIRLHSPFFHLILRSTSFLISSAADLHSLAAGEQLHAFSISFGLFHHASILSPLTSFYLSFGLLPSASSVAQSSPFFLPWNFLISAYVRNGFSVEALATYTQMLDRGVVPDCFTYPSLLKACGEAADLDFGREIHRSIDRVGLGSNLFVSNALVSMYLKCNQIDVARKLFDEMPEKDIVSWNSIISGYASRGLWEEALELFERAVRICSEVNSVTWNALIGCLLRAGDHIKALNFVSKMSLSKPGVDFVTVVIGLNACSRAGMLRLGKEIHGLAARMGYDELENVRNALIMMYSRCKDIDTAHLLLQGIKNPSLATWNGMLSGFALEDRAEDAAELFREMIQSGIQPNYVTIVTILALCARVSNLQHGQELHCYIVRQEEFVGYRLLWNSLVDMYSKSGRIMAARRVFDAMTDHDEVSYTSLIAGYGMQGEGIAAVQLFDEMIGCGIKPDHVCMVAVLSACSHSKLVSKGESLFNSMGSTFGIKPKMEHFSCMVDLYARAGLLEKAEEVINKVPFQPTSAMWAALVGACQVYRNIEIGERAAMKLLERDTDNAGHFVLIANMYAAANCWGELAKIRMMMRNAGVRKAPGCAWADLGIGFKPFLVGDRSVSVSPDVYAILESLTGQMSDEGYSYIEDLGYEG